MLRHKPFMQKMLFMLAILWTMAFPSSGLSQDDLWKRVDEGLYVMDSKITIVKIDPKFYSFRLLCATEYGNSRLTAKDWCLRHKLISAINAGMYREDGLKSVGYMKNFNHTNNPRLNNAYKAVLAFNRSDAAVPEIQIIDLSCQVFEDLKPKYQTFVQSIRMVSCRQENVWAKQDKASSLAVLGIDKNGNGLFVFSEAPYSGHDFINILLSLPISLHNAMYLEGGSETSLYLSSNGVELDRAGGKRLGLDDTLVGPIARPIPNIIGITKKIR